MRKAIRYKPILFLLVVFYCGCHLTNRVKSDPFYESFYEKTSLIMTQNEIKIYKSLKGEELHKEFIDEFWRIRDPYQGTEENENKIEFQERILFANEWFDRFRRKRDYEAKSARGWQTAKGRVYVVLGPPDKVSYGEGWGPLKKFPPQDAIYETWYYTYYDLRVSFEREQIKTELETISPHNSDETESSATRSNVSRIIGSGGWKMIPNFKIIDAIKDAKLKMISPQYRSDIHNGMQFKARYTGDHIKIIIPADKMIFVSEDEKLNVYLLVEIDVYRNEKKESEITENKVLSFSEDEVLELYEIIVEVPFTSAYKGEYSLDVTVTDLKAEYLSKYSQVIKHVFRSEFR
ncbi:MAG: GWxTD domain-containing protein [Candidatus Aminicenantes bacterium]|nr:GWxTD domain-containing protein [Candidatus Aminicenantes bacterium]